MAEKAPPAGKSDTTTECTDTEDAASSSDTNDTTTSQVFDSTDVSSLLNLISALRADLVGPTEPPEQVLTDVSVKGIAEFILSDKCNDIIVMTGAGISTAAGIPDFRSPGTGLYSQLEKYNLPYPQSIFELSYFKENPEPFFLLAKEMWPGNYKATISHYFIRLLEQKKLLLRSYTQNIDGLELVAGLSPDLLLPAHGTFHTSHCVECSKSHELEWIKEKVFAEEIPKCTDENCGGLVKPDIVFFGEALPEAFFVGMGTDFPKADLLIVMGSSLTVQPFCSLVDKVKDTVPRLLINREKVHEDIVGVGYGFDFDSDNKYRDVALLGDCDEGCLQLAELLGWKEELLELVKTEQAK